MLGVERPDLGVALVFARVPLRDRIEDGGVVRCVPKAAKHVLHRDDSVALVVDGPAAARQGEGTLAERIALGSRQAATRAWVALHTLRKLEMVLGPVTPPDAGFESRALDLLPSHARGHEQVVRELWSDRRVFDGERYVRDRVRATDTLRFDGYGLNLPVRRPPGHLKDDLLTDGCKSHLLERRAELDRHVRRFVDRQRLWCHRLRRPPAVQLLLRFGRQHGCEEDGRFRLAGVGLHDFKRTGGTADRVVPANEHHVNHVLRTQGDDAAFFAVLQNSVTYTRTAHAFSDRCRLPLHLPKCRRRCAT